MTTDLAALIIDLLAYADDATDAVWQHVPQRNTQDAVDLSRRLQELVSEFEKRGYARPTVYGT